MNPQETPTTKPPSDSPQDSTSADPDPGMLCWTLLLREQVALEAAGKSFLPLPLLPNESSDKE